MNNESIDKKNIILSGPSLTLHRQCKIACMTVKRQQIQGNGPQFEIAADSPGYEKAMLKYD